MAAHLPPTADSAVHRALNPDWLWGLSEHLTAGVLDALHGANWQRGGGKGKRPKPVQRPGLEPDSEAQTFGKGSALPLDEMAAWLGWDRVTSDPAPALPKRDARGRFVAHA